MYLTILVDVLPNLRYKAKTITIHTYPKGYLVGSIPNKGEDMTKVDVAIREKADKFEKLMQLAGPVISLPREEDEPVKPLMKFSNNPPPWGNFNNAGNWGNKKG